MSSFADIAIGRRAHADHVGQESSRAVLAQFGYGTCPRGSWPVKKRVLAAKRGPAPDTIFAEARSFLAPRTEAPGGKSEAICEAEVRRGRAMRRVGCRSRDNGTQSLASRMGCRRVAGSMAENT